MPRKNTGPSNDVIVNSRKGSEESKQGEIADESTPYDPYEHREVEHPNGDVGAFMHLIKSSIGAGVLSMPSAFKKGGLWFGVTGTIAMGFLVMHCCYIIVKTSRKQCRISRVPLLDYGQTAQHTFLNGPSFLKPWANCSMHAVNLSLYCSYYGLCSVYLVFAGNMLKQVVECKLVDDVYHVQLYVAAFIPLALILAQFRTLKRLTFFSVASNCLFLIGIVIIFYYIFNTPLPDIEERPAFGEWMNIPMFLTLVVLAMENVGTVMPLENNLRNPKNYLGCGILVNAMLVTMVLYNMIGFLGYWKYGENTFDSISMNPSPKDTAAIILKICIMFGVFFSYGLAFYIPTDIVWKSIKRRFLPGLSKKFKWLPESLFRLLMSLVTCILAIAVPKITALLGIVGALCFTTIGLLFPVILESISFWSDNRFENVLRSIKNVTITMVYLMLLCIGTYSAVMELLEFDSKQRSCH